MFSKELGAVIQTDKLECLKEYYDSWNLELTDEEVKKIKGLNKGYRTLLYKEYFRDGIDIFEWYLEDIDNYYIIRNV